MGGALHAVIMFLQACTSLPVTCAQAVQARADAEALRSAMEDTALSDDHAGIHAELQQLRSSLATAQAALENDAAAADGLRAKVLDNMKAAEETQRVLQINLARREVAAASVRRPAADAAHASCILSTSLVVAWACEWRMQLLASHLGG